MKKLQEVADRIQAKIDDSKHQDVKPVYFNNWVKKLFAIKMEIIKRKNRGEDYKF
jgi:hypothetical protein